MSMQIQRNVIPAQKPPFVVFPAAEGLLKAFAAWHTGISGSQPRCAIETLLFKAQRLDATVNTRTFTPLEKEPCAVARREILVRFATSLARRQTPETITLLAHIAWYFDLT